MLEAAGLQWSLLTTPLYHDDGIPVESHVALRRSDTRRVLAVVSKRYVPIGNAEAAQIIDAVLAEGQAVVEVAGALGHGERCWMLARIPQDFDVREGDRVKTYLLLAWGHDGKHAIAARLTPVRVVCANTLAAAGFGGGSWKEAASIYIPHRGQPSLRIEEARQALGLVRQQVEATATAYRQLAAAQLTPVETERILRAALPPQPTEAGRARDAWDEALATLWALAQGGTGQAPVKNTAWAAVNAVAEYVDHQRPIRKDGTISRRRIESAAVGAGAMAKRSALRTAWALVSG